MSDTHGGFAFPFMERGGGGLELTETGMSRRDYFAAKAMQSMASASDCTGDISYVCAKAYQYADAMLKASKS